MRGWSTSYEHHSRDDGQSIPERIKLLTRPLHTKLNRLITSRVADLSSRQTNNLACYTLGLFHVTIIYTTFEALWHTTLEEAFGAEALHDSPTHGNGWPDAAEIASHGTRVFSASPSPRALSPSTRVLLARLRSPRLLRSRALRQDLRSLTRWADVTIDEQLKQLGHSRPLAAFLSHIESTITARPYTVIAYAWVFYMALFSGGRHIRRQLMAGVLRQWSSPAASDASANSRVPDVGQGCAARTGRAFLHFADVDDGESIKQEFLRRIAQVDATLSVPQQDDVVEEARLIFEYMLSVVDDLDELCKGVQKPPWEAHKASLEQSNLRDSKEFVHRVQGLALTSPCWTGRLAQIPVWFGDMLTSVSQAVPKLSCVERLRHDGISYHVHWFGTLLKLRQWATSARETPSTMLGVIVLVISCTLWTWFSVRKD